MSDPEDQEKGDLLAPLRKKIDELDQRVVELLNERAKVVVEIGEVKRGDDSPIYAPAREAIVLKRIHKANRGPLSDRSLEGIYREIMSGSFALERPLRVAHLGPSGSFSHAAAVAQFGTSVDFDPLQDIGGVFDAVERGHADYGMVPIENSIGGGVVETLEAFLKCGEQLSIYAEVLVAIRHNLLARCGASEIKQIYSKPEVFSQCRRWVQEHFPQAELIAAPSSAAAARMVQEQYERDSANGQSCHAAAIGSSLAARLYGLETLFESIEDRPNNTTRFFVLSCERAERSTRNKTSFMFRTEDRQGALAEVLKVFADAGINLTHIDKRPSGTGNWHYTFFADAEGFRDDPEFDKAVETARSACHGLRILGSYPAATRVL